MITASHYKTVRPINLLLATEATIPAILVTLASWRLGFLPNFSPRYDAMSSALLMCTVVFLCACCVTLALLRYRKRDESVLILGTDDLARDLCQTLAEVKMIRQGEVTIACEQFNALSIEKRTTRIVVAEAADADRHHLATALIDCKLRGVTVEDAGKFRERLTGKLWVKRLSSDWWIY